MYSIEIPDLLKVLEKHPLNIIDIRSTQSFLLGKIPSAKHIDKISLLLEPNIYLKKTETYYIYCQSGTTSESVVAKLNSQGYHTVNIAGGYNNYLLRR